MDTAIDLKCKYKEQIVTICQKAFSDCPLVEVLIFGSRVNGSARKVSDIDLAVRSDICNHAQIALFRELLEESTIPYTVDVVVWNEAVEELRKKIKAEGVLLWKN